MQRKQQESGPEVRSGHCIVAETFLQNDPVIDVTFRLKPKSLLIARGQGQLGFHHSSNFVQIGFLCLCP